MTKFWTKEEEEFLKINYATKGANLCSYSLGRSVGSVRSKVNKLGLIKYGKTSRAISSEEYDLKLLEKEIDFIAIEPYLGANSPILHECIEGHRWKIKPSHILGGIGCPKCYGNNKKSNEEYNSLVPEGIKVLEPYNGNKTPILHECSYGHIWKTIPSIIIRGGGCPYCNTGGFNPGLPSILYYIKIEKDALIYYKIGITNRSVKERFSAEPSGTKITIIWEKHFETGLQARELEQQLLDQYAEFRAPKGTNFLSYGGNTELLIENIIPEPIPA